MRTHDTTRTVRFADVQAAAVSESCLVLIYGANDLGKRFELTKDITIGRDRSNDLVIDAQDVSRHHARVQRRASGEWWITDLASRNGTRRNGETLTSAEPLANGDLIAIGGVIFKFIAGGNVEALFHEEIYRMTIFDGLTRIANKRYLVEFLDREVARALRYGSRLSVAMIDIDLFKQINDKYGHPAGDLVLEKAAAAMSAIVRREQLLARYGGEEFAVVMPEIGREELLAFCEKLRVTIEEERFESRGERLPVTISIGAAIFEGPMSRDELIQRADEALYRAKRAGRNTVAI